MQPSLLVHSLSRSNNRPKLGEKHNIFFQSFLIFFFAFLAFIAQPHSVLTYTLSKTLVLSSGGDPKSFNEVMAQETSTTQITSLLFEGLTHFNTETGEVEGRLAEKWESSGDGLIWTFYLRHNVEWFDGVPFTGRDVLFTFQSLIFNPAIPAAARDIFTLGGKPILVEALDDHTVRFKLPSPFAPFLLALTQSIFPEHILKKAVEEGRFTSTWGVNSNPTEIIGTGPFKLATYRPGEKIELVKNDHYWQKDESGRRLPYLERVIFLILPNGDGPLLKFLEGETDFYGMSGKDYPLLKPLAKEKNFSIFEAGAGNGSNFLVFNQNSKDPVRRAWFQNKNFRRAVAHALDRGSMIDIVFNRLGVSQCSPLSPSIPFFFNQKVPCYEYDPEKAKSLLAQEGFRDKDGDGFLEDARGNKVEFVMISNAESSERLEMAGMLREDLARLGVKVNLLPMEFNTIVTKLVSTHDWDVALLGLTGEIDPHFGANVWRSGGSLHFWNAGAAKVPSDWEKRVDEIFDGAGKSLDRLERKRLYDEWQKIIAEELPLVYTVLPKMIYAVRDRFKNLRPTVLGGPFHNIERIDTKKS